MRFAVPFLLLVALLPAQARLPQGARAGEVTAESVLLQARVLHAEAAVRFAVEAVRGDGTAMLTELMTPSSERDFIVRAKVDGLRPATRYRWRVFVEGDRGGVDLGRWQAFRTLPAPDDGRPVRFVVTTCMNHHKFFNRKAAVRDDQEQRELGYPASAAIARDDPAFVVYAGDCVYYDQPRPGAKDVAAMRACWHRQHELPRVQELAAAAAGFWMKDDHDYRFNDCDNTKPRRGPTPEEGIRVFKEQVPVVPHEAFDDPTYRTRRVGKHLQVWFVEGRDYRSPNRAEDIVDKTLWGKEQRGWLQRTLAASDATYKLIVSPTPIVGPDDAYKKDNHANRGGFRHEGNSFLAWAAEQGLLTSPEKQGDGNRGALFWVCGDRHWQYHSVHPTGLHELSVGAHSDGNARRGRKPGDPKSTDPEGLVEQRWAQSRPSGGYLEVAIEPVAVGGALLVARFRDDHGRLVHETRFAR